MRLVNADDLREEFKLREEGRYYSSEPYLDYILNEWKTIPVEHGGYDPISVVDKAPTVDAIPVEWLKKQLDKYECSTYEGIETVLELWEKENE